MSGERGHPIPVPGVWTINKDLCELRGADKAAAN